jgi:hypothetical protein
MGCGEEYLSKICVLQRLLFDWTNVFSHNVSRPFYFRVPAIIITAPTAHRMPPTTGGIFGSDLVVMPIDASPTLTPCVSLCGTGTKKEMIPATSNTAPTQNIDFI